MIRRLALIMLLVVPGLIGVAIFGYFALQDWAHLQAAYCRYAAVARSSDLRTLTVAFNAQSIHRTNLFAEGVWTLLTAILAGIGVHGLCITQINQRTH